MDHVAVCEGLRVRGEIPGFHFKGAHLDAGEVADARDFRLVLRHGATCAELFDFFFAGVGALHVRIADCFGEGGGVSDNVDHVSIFRVVGLGCDGFRGQDGELLAVIAGVKIFFSGGFGGTQQFAGLVGGGGCEEVRS